MTEAISFIAGYVIGKGNGIVTAVPASHVALMNRIKVFYPWKQLQLQCVFVGQEEDVNKVVYPQSTWLCLWIDEVNIDVAAVIVVYERTDKFTLEISRHDAGNGEQLNIQIDNDLHNAVFTAPDTLPGLVAINVAK